jgi:hypothetical protein
MFLGWFRQRKAASARDAAAIARALQCFRATRNLEPMGAHIIRRDTHGLIVRVMYVTDHIPPDRAWYAVADGDGAIRELSFAESEDAAIWR